ncbi:hypothetical protein BTE77_34030 [Ensifer adhaerens]|nr:hypothetical protein BTE77_34030 [Ensifer adhaerens]
MKVAFVLIGEITAISHRQLPRDAFPQPSSGAIIYASGSSKHRDVKPCLHLGTGRHGVYD